MIVLLLKCHPRKTYDYKFITFLVVMAVSCSSATLFAQDGAKPANIGERTGPLVPTTSPWAGVAVVMRLGNISGVKIEALAKTEHSHEPFAPR
jgi:hypothetical protein